MKRSTYEKRDYPFGQRMLTLRTRIGLTQAGLAKSLGVSRQSVGDWEAGSSYPKVDHLKCFIELGMQWHTFEAGNEEEEILTLWRAAHQKVLIDEAWLQAVLSQTSSPFSCMADAAIGPVVVASAREPRIDWSDAPINPSFHGREQELAQLSHWVVEERCRVVTVLGQGGIGKSALAVNLMHRVAPHFEVVIWRSLRDAPTYDVLLDQCLQILAPQSLSFVSTSPEQRLDLLLEHLQIQRTLIVLDNLETLLEEGRSPGRIRVGYEGYSQLLRRIAETQHQSCLLLTSREHASEILSLERDGAAVRTWRLTALDTDACEQLLAEKKIAGSAAERRQLIKIYSGNPLALNIVAQTIAGLFAGEIAPFLEQGEIVFDGIRKMLAGQFTRLSLVEQTVILWLAIVREPISIEHLQALLVMPLSRAQVLETLEALHHRSLIERGRPAGSFTLQSVILEYATGRFLAEAASEIQHGQLVRLIEHSLELTTVKEYIRQTQQRLIVAPLLAQVRSMYLERDEVEKRLLVLLNLLRTRADDAQGYGPANILALLREQRGDLCGLDLSLLSIRGAFLQGVEMQDTSLAKTTFRNVVFTQSFDMIRAVAIGPHGYLWATGSRRGKTQVWYKGGEILHLAWQAHADTVRTLAFSPDGATLATGSWDGAIKLWNPERGTLLWTNWLPTKIQRIAFAPDGRTLASGGGDATIRLWDTTSGAHLLTLPRQNSPVQALAWSPNGHLLASGGHDGSLRIWEQPGEQPNASVQELAGHTTWVTGLAFSPDGRTLASGSFDQTVKLWEVESGRCLQILTGHTNPVFAIAWSSDGRLLASSGQGTIIWLWDVERGTYRAALHENKASVYAIAFTPDSHHLLSSSDDGSLRLWDTERGLRVQSLQSYAVSLYDVAWSPDGKKIASAGTDTVVTIWDVESMAPLRVLYGHSWVVQGVTWSPDGKTLASSGWDNTIRIWDATTGDNVQILQDPNPNDTLIFDVAWSPDGKSLAGACTFRGVQVWEVNTGITLWIGQTNTSATQVAWSPDGTQLASCSDDGNVYLWDASSGMLLLRLVGHHGMVKSVAWSPDSRQLASGSGNQEQGDNGELFVWDVQSGQRVHTFVGHLGAISTLTWATSEKWLISGGSDGMLRWWDMQRKECVRIRKAHQGTLQSLKTSPNGRLLASCGDDNAIHIWDLESGDLLRTQRRARPYERLDISETKGLNQAQKASLCVLGAIEHPPTPGNQCNTYQSKIIPSNDR